MNPLEALSALGSAGTGSMQLPLTQTTATAPSAPIGEFNNMMGDIHVPEIQSPSIAMADMGSSGPSTWGHMVQQMVKSVSDQQQTAQTMVSDVLRGGPTPVHQAMIATEEAGLSFAFLNEVRNKVVDAYQQVMQMQV
jgi:flagellar hook-basal body complex protein FliE